MQEDSKKNLNMTVESETAVVSDSVPKSKEKKTGNNTIIWLIAFAILAIGGIAFGVYGMISQNGEINALRTDLANCAASDVGDSDSVVVTCPDGTSVEAISKIDNDAAQTIINPYLVHFGAFDNILDYAFDMNAKMKVTFHNIGADKVNSLNRDGEWSIVVPYCDFNNEFKYLFGSDQEIEKRDYDTPYFTELSYTDQYSGVFKIGLSGIGGSGATMFSIVKDAQYVGDNLIVNVYHGVAPWCEGLESDSCVVQYTSSNSDAISKYIEKNANSISVYLMTFSKDNGHYVLTNIQKQ